MATLLSKYFDDTKNVFPSLFLGIVIILIALFMPIINQHTFRFLIFKILTLLALIYCLYVIFSKSLPLIKEQKTNILAEANKPLKNSIIYNSILVIFIFIFIWHVLFISL